MALNSWFQCGGIVHYCFVRVYLWGFFLGDVIYYIPILLFYFYFFFFYKLVIYVFLFL